MPRRERSTMVPTVLAAGLLSCGSALLAQESLPSSNSALNEATQDPALRNEIIVTGERPYDEETLRESVRDIAMRGRLLQRPLPRFNAPICLHVAGLVPDVAQAVSARIEQNVRTLGLPLGEEGCRINALVVSAIEPEDFIKGFRKVQPWAFTPRGNQLIHQALKRGDPAIPWASSSFTDFAGESLQRASRSVEPLVTPRGARFNFAARGGTLVAPGALADFGLPGAAVGVVVDPNGTRAVSLAVLNRMNSAIVFDADRISGFTTTQLADYATMHLLGDLQPRVDFSDDTAYSILEMFNVGAENAAVSLTLLDRAYLHGTYRMQPNAFASRLEASVKIAYSELLSAVCEDVSGCDPQNPMGSESAEAGS